MSPVLRLTKDARDRIAAAAAAHPHREVCGLLVQGAEKIEAHATPNVHPEPETGFAVCDTAHVRLQRATRARDAKIIGCFHSHPSGDTAPSETDLLAINEDGFIWLICAADGRMQAWVARRTGGVKRFDPMEIVVLEPDQAAA